MKLFGLVFIGLITLFLYNQARASTPVNHTAFCAGYASQMNYQKKKKVYVKMQKYFDDKIPSGVLEKNQITSEYYQSGVDAASKNPVPSLATECEGEYKANK